MLSLVWFDDIEGALIQYTGGKGASLSKMHKSQLPVPNGFVVTAPFFLKYLQENELVERIIEMIETIDHDDFDSIESISENIRKLIIDTPIPPELEKDIINYYNTLGGVGLAVAVRSSSTAEDLDDASFAGQQETFLYVLGKDDLIEKIKCCWASLYNGRAIFYRKQKGFNEREVSIAVVVQQMVNSEKAGVMFTVNPITKDRNHALIEGAWGLGEGVVSGEVTPDSYTVDKSTHNVLEEYISEKEMMIVRNISSRGVEEKEVPEDKKCARVLTEDEIKQLTEMSVNLEKFFGKPQDIEWAIEKNKLYLLQSRPITTL